jgi:hypothetical protein
MIHGRQERAARGTGGVAAGIALKR